MASELPTDVADAHLTTLRDLRSDGSSLGVAPPTSLEGKKSGPDLRTVELMTYSTGMSNPRRRIATSAEKKRGSVGAVARFTWLIAGSDRLEDIAYYENKVRNYTDDGLIVPGSSYGKRIFSAAPGLDQIRGVVTELRRDPDSRRAAAVVWLPEDAVRASKDIPCTFGLFFHIRDEALIMTTVMRSNNALTLLPFNFFEFSMIGEMVAAEVGVEFGAYRHWAASMHSFIADSERIDSLMNDNTYTSLEMEPMPRGDALEQGRRLAVHEAELRHAEDREAIYIVLDKAHKDLNTYWLGLFNVLLAFGFAKRGMGEDARTIVAQLSAPLADGTGEFIEAMLQGKESVEEGALFGASMVERSALSARAILIGEASTINEDGSVLWTARILDEISAESGEPATATELLGIFEQLRPRKSKAEYGLAAREGAGTREPTTLATRSDVVRLLREMRQGKPK